MKHVLVNGAGGFIGSPMVDRLKAEGGWVRAVDPKRNEFTIPLADEFIIGDLRARRLATDAGTPIGKRADPAAHGEIARWPARQASRPVPPGSGATAIAPMPSARRTPICCFVRARAAGLPTCRRSGWATGRVPSTCGRVCARAGGGGPTWTSAAGLESCPTRVWCTEAVLSGCRDVLAVAARADAAWLRLRYAAPTEAELREWRQVWDSVS